MAITPPVAGQEISATAWGIPITNEVNRLTPLVDSMAVGAWVNMALNAPYTNVGGARALSSYRKRGVMVDIRMSINNAAAGGGNMFTLPVGHRPTHTLDLISRDGGTGAYVPTIINILADGQIMCYLSTSANAGTLVSFFCSFSTT